MGVKIAKHSENSILRDALLEQANRRKQQLERTNIKPFGEWLAEASPNYTYESPHFKYIIDKLQAVIDGKIRKLCIFVPPRHGKCLPGNTLVTLANGSVKPLRYISPGEKVVAFDIANSRRVSGTVTAKSENGVKGLYVIKLSNGASLSCTGNHKLLTYCGWEQAADLAPGDFVGTPTTTTAVRASGNNPLVAKDITWVPIVKITRRRAEPTYDLEVKDFHNFVANGIIVHNSELTSVRLPAYLLERDPANKVVIASTSAFLAEEFSRKCRDIVRARNVVQLNQERQSVTHWKTKHDGFLRAVGLTGTIVGQGFDYIIVDDPVKGREEVESLSQRDKQWQAFKDDLYTRRNSAKAAVIVILTRWHEDDLGGRILESNPAGTDEEWTIIRLPAKSEGDDPADYPVARAIGEPLWAERVPLSMLNDIESMLGDSFASLYQQRPTPKDGKIFRSDWFSHRIAGFPRNLKRTQMWDTAMDTNARNDYSAMVEGCWNPTSGRIFIAAMVNEKMEFPDLVESASLHFNRLGYENVEVATEDKANGKPLVQQMRLYGIPVIEVPSGTKDKVVRARSITNFCAGGNITLVDAPGNCNTLLLDQLMTMPYGKYDDLADAFVHLVRRLTQNAIRWSDADIKKFAVGMVKPRNDYY